MNIGTFFNDEFEMIMNSKLSPSKLKTKSKKVSNKKPVYYEETLDKVLNVIEQEVLQN